MNFDVTKAKWIRKPENPSFKATFTDMQITECKWLPHDGQQPDEE